MFARSVAVRNEALSIHTVRRRWTSWLALTEVVNAQGGTFYISAPSLPCYAERKTYR